MGCLAFYDVIQGYLIAKAMAQKDYIQRHQEYYRLIVKLYRFDFNRPHAFIQKALIIRAFFAAYKN